MYMADWISKLDDFLRLSGRDVLDHLGSMSHDAALEKAEAEFEKYRQSLMLEKSPVEVHFEAAVKQLKTLDRKKTSRQPD